MFEVVPEALNPSTERFRSGTAAALLPACMSE